LFAVSAMDDWKLNTTPVVRLERPRNVFVYFWLFYCDVHVAVSAAECRLSNVDVD